MRISVVITFFNKGHLIEEALDSVLPQLAANDEIIIIDDHSTDEASIACLNDLQSSHDRPKFLHNDSNQGAAFTKDRGIRESSGDIILLLDADDALPDGSVDAVRNAFLKNPEADLVFGDYTRIDNENENGTPVAVNCSVLADDRGKLVPKRLVTNWILLGSAPFRKAAYLQVGGFDPCHPTTDDRDFQRRLLAAGGTGVYVAQEIYIWRRSESGNNARISFLEQQLSWFRSIDFYLSQLSVMEFLPRLAWRFTKLTAGLLIQCLSQNSMKKGE